jgi:hypothetical protein
MLSGIGPVGTLIGCSELDTLIDTDLPPTPLFFVLLNSFESLV